MKIHEVNVKRKTKTEQTGDVQMYLNPSCTHMSIEIPIMQNCGALHLAALGPSPAALEFRNFALLCTLLCPFLCIALPFLYLILDTS